MKPAQDRYHYTRSALDSQSGLSPWKVLVAGHGPRVSDIASLALNDMSVDGIPVEIFRAATPAEARERLAVTPDVALLLLALTSRQDREWTDLPPWIRQDLGDARIRIAACFEELAPDREIHLMETYDINDIIAVSRDDFHRLRLMVKKELRTARSFRDLEAKLNRRRQVESQLEEKKAAFNDLIENIGDMVWETGRDHRFSYVSANIRALFGHTWEDLHGKSFDYAMDQETRTTAWPEIETAMGEHQQFTNINISRIHKDGTPRYFLTSGRPFFDATGRWKGFRGVEKDITALVHSEQEKKRLIAQLRHAQRLEAMGALAGGIAHDFNNILGGILGYTQLIQFEINDNPVALGYTEHIISGCNRAKNLILQILDFSRQRECATPPKHTAPGKIVAEAVKLLRASIPSSIRLETDIRKDAGKILADPSQIHQAVMNLCTNARQAIESGQGKITVRVSSVTLTPENHSRTPELDLDFGTYTTIAVTDTGKGIETNTLEKIFNPYFTTKKRGDGSGLGLSVVHGIVTRFNGIISVATRPGEGSTFTLYFPEYRDRTVPEKKHRPRLVQGQSNVLFIDDEPMLVDIGRMMLEKLGYTVTALDTPLEGLSMIASDPRRFDVVITDMTMPDILGTQLAARIKRENPDLPVVLATGFSNLVQTQKATPAGVDAVLPKPITMDSLSQTLFQVLNA